MTVYLRERMFLKKKLRVSQQGVTIDGWFSHTEKWNKRKKVEIVIKNKSMTLNSNAK